MENKTESTIQTLGFAVAQKLGVPFWEVRIVRIDCILLSLSGSPYLGKLLYEANGSE